MHEPHDLDPARARDDGTRRGMLALGVLGAAALLVGALLVFFGPGGASRAAPAQVQSPAATAVAAAPPGDAQRDAATLERDVTVLTSRIAAADARPRTQGSEPRAA